MKTFLQRPLTLAQRQDWWQVHFELIVFFHMKYYGTTPDTHTVRLPTGASHWPSQANTSSLCDAESSMTGGSCWEVWKCTRCFTKKYQVTKWISLGPCQQPRAHPHPLWLNCQNILSEHVVSQYHAVCLWHHRTGRFCLQNKHTNIITKQ